MPIYYWNSTIKDKLLKKIIEVFSSNEKIEKAILFGSRASNTEKYNSDIDIAIIGDNDLLFCERIKEELSNIPTLLKFDIVNYYDIKNPNLKNHIDEDGIVIYDKN